MWGGHTHLKCTMAATDCTATHPRTCWLLLSISFLRESNPSPEPGYGDLFCSSLSPIS